MKGYNKNRYQYNVQLSTNNKPISFEQMWAMNQTANSPQIISNPLSKAYMNTGGDIGGAMQSLAPLASLTPLGPLGGAAVGAAGSLISMFSKPSQANPTTGFANTNQYGHMATGGSMEQISPNAMEVTGGQGQVDGNDINYKGQQMSLDHGEVVDTNQDIVFSNRLFDPRSGKSFADTVKPLEKLIGKLSKRPSVLNNNTIQALEKQKQVLFQTQEKVAQAMGKRNQDGSTVQPGQEQQMQQPGMASGGYMDEDPGLPKKFGGASRADSIAVMNSANATKNYYNNSKYKTVILKDNMGKSPTEFEHSLETDVKDYSEREGILYPNKNGGRSWGKLPENLYTQKVNKYQRKQKENASAILDTRAPMTLYDYRIQPKQFLHGENIDKKDPLNGDIVTIPIYDPISVKPYDMRTAADHAYIKKNYPDQYKAQYKTKSQVKKIVSSAVAPTVKPTVRPTVKQNVQAAIAPTAQPTPPAEKIPVSQYNLIKNGIKIPLSQEEYNAVISKGSVQTINTGKFLDKNKYVIKPVIKPVNKGMAMGGKMKYGYGGQPDFTDLFNTPGYKMALQGAKEVSTNNQTIPSLRNTGGLQETTKRTIPRQDIPNTAFDQRQGQFKYAKGFEEYAKQDLDPNLINKTAQAFLQSPEGQAHERIQKGLNPKYKGFKPDNVIGSNYNILFQNPAYKAMLQTPGQSIPNYATQASQTYQEGLIPKTPSGTTEDNKRSDDPDASPMGELFPAESQTDRYERLFGAKTPYGTKSGEQGIGKSKFTTGDYMQLGAVGVQSIAALLDRPHTPPARTVNSPITENRYNPARALQENQFTTNAAVNALGNNYSSAGVNSGLQNLYANKYKADSRIIQNYDQMNQQAKTQYEERLGQRDQFNSQIQTQNDVIKQQDRANYTNGLYNALESVSNVGKGLNQKESSDKALKYLMLNDPEAYKSFMSYMKTKSTTDPATTSNAFGGKIKFRKRR